MHDPQQYAGQIVDGQFPLLRYLGGGARSAVFQTEYGAPTPQPAAIKFIPAESAVRERQLAAWETTAKLSHPHLLQIFAGGEHRLGDTDCLYVVTEYAQEHLGEVVPERALTAQEARDMLGPVLGALAYLHGQGFVHGSLKPSNVMAVDDHVKLASDSVALSGPRTPADDCQALGNLLQRSIPSAPEPFGEIVRHCLDPDPQTRWKVARIEHQLRENPVAPKPLPWRSIGIATALALAAGAAGISWFHREPPPTRTPSTPSSVAISLPGKAPRAQPRSDAWAGAAPGVASQVLPNIPQQARDTIQGRVRIRVRVSVDPSGKVAEAALEPPFGSKYFADRALEASRRWKFQPVGAPEEWILRYEFLRDDTRVTVARAGP